MTSTPPARLPPGRARPRGALFAFWLLLAFSAPGAAGTPQLEELPLPLPEAFASPALTVTPLGPILSWIEAAGSAHAALRYAVLGASGWSRPETVVRDVPFWLGWADPPWLTVLDDGTRVAHWPERVGTAPYAYVTRMALKRPGAPWESPFLLHDDTTPVQHGLSTVVRAADGVRHYLWLDARDDAWALFTRTLDPEGRLGPEQRIDAMTCSCCRLAAVPLPDGDLLTAYRDRTDDEVRDIRLQRHTADGWHETGWHSADGWVIAGCPVNGPALAVAGERVALAWFTAADDRNRVLLSRSVDAGRSFTAPGRLDAGDPVGQPSLLFDGPDRLLATWIEWTAAGPRLFLAIDPGTPGAVVRDLGTASGTYPGHLRLLAHDGEPLLFVASDTSARLYRLAPVP